ncbi:MAG: methyltransferase domain-containing protein [Cytophagales bacterium]|nr:methyltransferase domain-containing protein [Bernardetiaceae bacterium]MDW8204049.1 methyltransferase domain-containing protein [Cytophagales bacterium]
MTHSFTQLLICPQTGEKVFQLTDKEVVTTHCSYPLVDNVPVMLPQELLNQQEATIFFENFYQNTAEPWDYSERAAELLRHDYVVDQVARMSSLLGRKAIILDIGCSLGHITARLHPYAELLVGMDISLTAIKKARQRCLQSLPDQHNPYLFVVGSATDLPFKDHCFDIVVASDGLHGWHLSDHLQRKAVKEIYRVMKPHAYAVFTDYLHPRLHPKIEPTLRQAPWQIERIELLYDRLWYRFESLLKAFRHTTWAKKVLANKPFALFLKKIARNMGKTQSKHIAAIVSKR